MAKKKVTGKRRKLMIRDSFAHFCWNVTLVVETPKVIYEYEFMADRVFATKERAESWMKFTCPASEYRDWMDEEHGITPVSLTWRPQRYQYMIAQPGFYRTEDGVLKKKPKPKKKAKKTKRSKSRK